MHGTVSMLVGLLVVLAAAKIAGELFERMKQPAVIGELLVGMLIGPYALGLVHQTPSLEVMATIGVVILMFAVGLETKSREIFHVGRTAFIVGAIGVVLPLAAGLGFGRAMGYATPEALFIGTALVATSVGITARVLADRGLISTRIAKIVLAAAVIDDVLGMLVLSVVTGSVGGDLNPARIALTMVEAVGFIAIVVLVGPRLVAKLEKPLEGLHIKNAPFVAALGSMFAFAALAESIGLAAIVGAFFAGMAFAECPERWGLATKTESLYEWLVPYFFVMMGAAVNVKLFASPAVLVPGLVLVAIAVVTKIVGCGLGIINEGPRTALAVGVGMVPRGEVGLIVAAVGQRMGIITPTVYAMIILVIVVSTLVVPPVLPGLFQWARSRSASPSLASEPAAVGETA
jgi:Kef-type K+ transport system membrane component KefB